MKRFFTTVILAHLASLALLLADGARPVAAQQVPQTHGELVASFAPVVKRAAPAVVNIYTRRKVRVESPLSPLMADPFLREFFGNQFEGLAMPRERVESSLGSGVIVGPKGLIVTNHHVVKDGDEITVVLADRREFEARVVHRDAKADLAVLRIDPRGATLPTLALRDSDTLEIGDIVLAIGNPFGVGQTVTQGIVSAVARSNVGASDAQFFIQTDAAINPGNSGGALVDTRGELVGINTAIFSQSGGSIGIGFAIPSTLVRAVLRDAKEGGKAARPWFGAAVQEVTPDIAESLGLDRPRGALIKEVYADSPAARAGLKVGDVVVMAGGHPVDDSHALGFRIATARAGETIVLRYLRSGREQEAQVVLTPPPAGDPADTRTLSGDHPLSGATVATLSPALALELDLDPAQRGVAIVGVRRDSLAGEFGFHKGDVMLAVNRADVATADALARALKAAKTGWRLRFLRDGQTMSLTVR